MHRRPSGGVKGGVEKINLPENARGRRRRRHSKVVFSTDLFFGGAKKMGGENHDKSREGRRIFFFSFFACHKHRESFCLVSDSQGGFSLSHH